MERILILVLLFIGIQLTSASHLCSQGNPCLAIATCIDGPSGGSPSCQCPAMCTGDGISACNCAPFLCLRCMNSAPTTFNATANTALTFDTEHFDPSNVCDETGFTVDKNDRKLLVFLRITTTSPSYAYAHPRIDGTAQAPTCYTSAYFLPPEQEYQSTTCFWAFQENTGKKIDFVCPYGPCTFRQAGHTCFAVLGHL